MTIFRDSYQGDATTVTLVEPQAAPLQDFTERATRQRTGTVSECYATTQVLSGSRGSKRHLGTCYEAQSSILVLHTAPL
jgi:hypothetical protein